MSGYDFQAVKAANPIASVVGRWVTLKERGVKSVGLCPFHDDHDPSFWVYHEKGTYICFACQARGDVIDFVQNIEGIDKPQAIELLGGKRLPKPNGVRAPVPSKPANVVEEWTPVVPAPEDASPMDPSSIWNPSNSAEQSFEPVEVYPYQSPDGIEGYVFRMEYYGRKAFVPVTYCRHRDTGEMRWCTKAMPGPNRVMYGRNELDFIPKARVFVVEGEKAKEAASRIFPKSVCVTWSGGANAVKFTDFTPLHGREVILWPDADEAGVKAMHYIANLLHIAGSPSIKIINTMSLDKGWDAADAEKASLEKTLNLKDFFRDRVSEYNPDIPPVPAQHPDEESSDEPTSVPNFRFTPVSHLIANPRKPDWLVKGFLEVDSTAMLFSDPGVGKSFVAVDIACSVATGREWNGHRVQKGPVAYICGEGHNGMARRFRAWEIARAESLNEAPLVISHGHASFTDVNSAAAVLSAVKKLSAELGEPPKLIIIDTVARTFGPGNENSTQEMGQFIQAVDSLRHATGAAVLLCHHTLRDRNEKHRARGSMALTAALDFEYGLSNQKDLECLVIATTKCKDHEPFDDLGLKFCTVDLGIKDEDGEPVTSAVLNFTQIEKREIEPAHALPDGKSMPEWLVLVNCLKENGFQNGINLSLDKRELQSIFCSLTGKPSANFRKALESARKKHKVNVYENDVQLSLAGSI